jgi:hypothetical protein
MSKKFNKSLNFNYLSSNVSFGSISASTFTGSNLSISGSISSVELYSNNITGGNIVGTTISAGTLLATLITGGNLSISGTVTAGNLLGSTINGTNSTITNAVHTALSTGTLNATTSVNSAVVNATTRVSSANLNSSAITTGTIYITSSDTWQTGLNITNNNNNTWQLNVGGSTNNAVGINNIGLFNGTYRMVVTSTGNIGIGTGTPESKLHVNGAITIEGETVPAAGATIIDSSNLNQTYITFKPNGSSNDWAYLRQIGSSNNYLMALDIHDDGDEPGFCIRSITSTASPDTVNERFRVQANGNVGIGNSSPSEALHVEGNILIKTGGSLWITGNSDNALNRLRFHNTGSSSYLDYGGSPLNIRAGTGTIGAMTASVVFTTSGTMNVNTLVSSANISSLLITVGTLLGSTINGTNSTITNAVNTAVSTGTLNATTSVSSTALFATNITGTNIVGTSISAGTILGNTLVSSANISALLITVGTLLGSTINGTNSTITNAVHTTISTGTLEVSSSVSQYGAAASNYNAYLKTNNSGQSSTTLLNPGVILFNQSGTYNYGMDMGSTTTGRYRTRIFAPDTADIAFSFAPTGGSTSQGGFTDRVVITGSGNMGIGTTSPNSALTIFSTAGSSNTESGNSGISINSSLTYATASLYMGADATNNIGWISASRNGNYSNLILNPRGGSVGINTTSPATTLDVTGTFRATTSITTGLLNATNVTATNVVATTISSGTILGTNIVGTAISAGTLVGTTITGANLSLSGNLVVGGTLTTVNITTTNVVDTNISTGTLTGTNINATTISASTLVGTLITGGNLSISGTVTTGRLLSTNITATNIVGTTISSGTLVGTVITGGNLSISGTVTAGTVLSTNITATNIVGTTISSGTLVGAVITGGNLSISGTVTAGTVLGTNITATNIVGTTISAGTLVGTVITGGNLSISGTVTVGTLLATTRVSSANLNSSAVSTGTLNATGTMTVGNTLIFNSDPILTVKHNSGSSSVNSGTILLQQANNTGVQLRYEGNTGADMMAIRALTGGVTTGTVVVIKNTGTGIMGINTTSPSCALDISNGTTSSNAPFLRLSNSAGGAGNQVGIRLNPYSGRAGGDSSQIIAVDDNNSSSHLTFYTAPTGDASISAERMRIMNNGYVGVGTQNPGSYLEISGTGIANGLRHTNNTCSVETFNDGNSGWLQTFTNHPLKFSVNNGTPLMTLNTNGNFGIGTELPSASVKLQVIGKVGIGESVITESGRGVLDVKASSIAYSSGTLMSEYALTLSNQSAANGSLGIAFGISNVATMTPGASIIFERTASTNVGLLHFCTRSGALATSPNVIRMTVQTTGNVGIGTTAPTSTLQINGSLAKTSGTFDIKHPIVADKRLVHSFIEGPRCDLIYRGKVTLQNGEATVNLDTDCVAEQGSEMTQGTFEALCTNPDYYLQNNSSFDRIRGSISGNILTIICENSSSTDKISWIVVAERKDTSIKEWDRTNSNGFLITEYLS